MNRFILAGLAANLFGLATIGLFGGALICVIIAKTTLAGQLALGGLVAALATGGSFAYAASNISKFPINRRHQRMATTHYHHGYFNAIADVSNQ